MTHDSVTVMASLELLWQQNAQKDEDLDTTHEQIACLEKEILILQVAEGKFRRQTKPIKGTLTRLKKV